VIRGLANIMIESKNDEKIFIGHVGGDDFISILDDDIAEDYARRVVKRFEDDVYAHYNEGHRAYGYIEAIDRRGNAVRFPLMRVSAGITNTKQHPGSNYHELTEFAAECKSVAKKSEDKVYIDGRIH
jgi:GGDEF domain-containing protein